MFDFKPVAARSEVRAAPAASRAALAGAVALALALGVGRFAFTPLLPMMLKRGQLDIEQGGWLASLNCGGYLAGALLCGMIRVGPARMVRFGLLATALLTLAMAAPGPFWVWALIRFAAGVVSAWAFVFASQWGLRQLAGAPGRVGVIFAGPGIGIVATGLLGMAAGNLPPSWVWTVFAAGSAAAAAAVWTIFDDDIAPTSGHAAAPASRPSRRLDAAGLVCLYGLAGFGYIITATFLPVIARQALPGSAWPDLFWPAFGVALMVGAVVAARLPAAWDNRRLLSGCYIVQALGIGLGILSPTAPGLLLGSVLIGLPFTAIPMFAMREARRLRGEAAAGLMGYATAAYGLGQIVGPLVAAPMAARTGSFSPALWIAVAVLTTGAAGLAWLGARRPD